MQAAIRRWGVAFACIAATASIAFAGELRVPRDYATIQAAIVAAVDGDTVEVDPGVYIESIDFMGKSIAVRSTEGPAVTAIDAAGLDSVVTFVEGETREAVIEGFTLTHGVGHYLGSPDVTYGGAIICSFASPTICGNWIIGNQADVGGGIYANRSPLIEGNRIQGNDSSTGGGVYLYYGTPGGIGPEVRDNEIVDNNAGTLSIPFFTGVGGGITFDEVAGEGCFSNNLVARNHAFSSLAGGGGVYWSESPDCDFSGNTIVENTCDTEYGGGVIVSNGFTDPPSFVVNSIIVGNSFPDTYAYSDSIIEISYTLLPASSVGTFGPGVIHDDPGFVTGAGGRYFLRHAALGQGDDSPCIDAGDPTSQAPDATSTRTDGLADSDVVDIGYHYPLARVYVAFIRGDFNSDGNIDISDAIAGLAELFVPETPPLDCDAAADVNNDNIFDISDIIFLLSYSFAHGPDPDPPFPDCGPGDPDGGPVCLTPTCP